MSCIVFINIFESVAFFIVVVINIIFYRTQATLVSSLFLYDD